APAGHLEDDLFEAALLGLALREDFGLPAVALGVTRVHPIQIRREERGLFPALAGAYFEDDVLLVERIARHELSAQACDELLGFRGELHDFLAGEVAHVRVVAFEELLRFGKALLDIAKRADGL